ncbi:MAG: ABC transporter permease [Chloroflexota bacterium]
MTSAPTSTLGQFVAPPRQRPFRWQVVTQAVSTWPVIPSAIILLAVVLGVLAPVLPLLPQGQANLGDAFVPPFGSGSSTYLLGTDQLGRDLLGRIIFGVRTSMVAAFAGVAITAAIGTSLGLLAGYFRGWIDTLVMRAVDVVLSLPGILAAMPIIAALGPGMRNLLLVLAILGWGAYARIVRSEVLSLRERDYVRLAVVAGCSTRRILFVHILPNVVGSLIVLASLNFGSVIIFESGMSFLGLGVQPPDVSLGMILAESRSYFSTAWWLMFPGATLTVIVLAFNFLGDWLRDRLNPRRS